MLGITNSSPCPLPIFPAYKMVLTFFDDFLIGDGKFRNSSSTPLGKKDQLVVLIPFFSKYSGKPSETTLTPAAELSICLSK